LVPGLDVSSVVVDNREGASLATHHLIEHGRRRIACIAGPPDLDSSRSRVDGWRSAMQHAGLPLNPPIHSSFGRRAGYDAALSLIDTSNVDACFVASDEQALGVLRALGERGVRCPGDVAVASFDGIAAAAYATPALTTVAQPFADIGRAAIAGLLERINRPAGRSVTAVLPVTLVRRGSCGCPDPPGGEAR
jgi:LacI family transcriptional regulator